MKRLSTLWHYIGQAGHDWHHARTSTDAGNRPSLASNDFESPIWCNRKVAAMPSTPRPYLRLCERLIDAAAGKHHDNVGAAREGGGVTGLLVDAVTAAPVVLQNANAETACKRRAFIDGGVIHNDLVIDNIVWYP
jgi:hypothetical protein